MIKHTLLASIAVCLFCSPVLASPKPTDVPTPSLVTPLYKTDGTTNITIDPAVTPMPVVGLTNIPEPSNTGRIGSVGPYDGTADPYLLNNNHGGTGTEAKMRTQADFSHMLPDDPIRNFGQPGMSHLHCFFGAGSTNAYSTYKTLRQHSGDSFAAGSGANATGYWFPCVTVLNPYSDGKNFALKPDFVTIYYSNTPALGESSAFIPIGLRYVFGFDMDAASVAYGTGGQYAWLQAALDTANTAQGRTRYTLTDPNGNMSTRPRWLCPGATPITAADTHFETGSSKYLAMGDGSDPFGGTCAAGNFFLRIDGSECYDGTNLWADGGYKNFIPTIWDSDFSQFVCPYNYYHLPKLTIEIQFQQNGAADYTRWVLSSDLAYRTAHSLTATQVPNGTTFHTDWDDGWDQLTRNIWEINCIGSVHHISHTCNSSTISSTQNLLGAQNGAGVSRNPQVDTTPLNHTLETDNGWMLIPPAWSGGLTNMKMPH